MRKIKREREIMLTLCNSSLDAAKPNVKAEPPKTRAVAIANAFATTLNRTINNKDPKTISPKIKGYILLYVNKCKFSQIYYFLEILPDQEFYNSNKMDPNM